QSSFVPPTLKKQIIKVAGIMQRPIPPEKKKEGDVQIYTYDEMNTRICARFEEMKPFLQHYFKGYAIPRQKHTPRAKPAGPISYSELRVRTNSIEDTKRLYKELNELGKYFCSSSVEYLEQMRSQMASVQLFLGGIGFISFFIAAIGIANTMMMSIYERTKEIGIFKVLGCSMRKIRSLFLMESAMIGLIGGILGVALSFLIRSLIINGVQSELFQPYIPPYLPPIAIACSTLIGVIAGFSPARRAMRLSPLKAIHNE
ncbi:MAG: FtsX-like permease family protein, partial [Eubacteriales bacterium]|nr:FtsX-like permease family protein [Eubacteriales bacterium]